MRHAAEHILPGPASSAHSSLLHNEPQLPHILADIPRPLTRSTSPCPSSPPRHADPTRGDPPAAEQQSPSHRALSETKRPRSPDLPSDHHNRSKRVRTYAPPAAPLAASSPGELQLRLQIDHLKRRVASLRRDLHLARKYGRERSLIWAREHSTDYSLLLDKCWKVEHGEYVGADDPGELSDDEPESRQAERERPSPPPSLPPPIFHLVVDEIDLDVTLGERGTADSSKATAQRLISFLALDDAHWDTEFPVHLVPAPTGDHRLLCPWPIGKFGNPFQPGWKWQHFDPYRFLPDHARNVSPMSALFKELAEEASALDFVHRSNTQRHVVSTALRLHYPLRQTVREPDVLELCRTHASRLSPGIRRRFGAEPSKQAVYSEFHLLDISHWMRLHRCGPAAKDRVTRKTWLRTLSTFLTIWLPQHSENIPEPAAEPFHAGPEPFDEPVLENDEQTMHAIWVHLLRCGLKTFSLLGAVRELAERELQAEEFSQLLRAHAIELGMSQSAARQYTAERAKWFPILNPTDSRIRVKLSDAQVLKLIAKQTEAGQENFSDAWAVL